MTKLIYYVFLNNFFRKYFQTQINQLLCSNIWPLTCYQPLSYPIQPVGNLNLIDVSFEEIRCDFYALKNIVADPESVHVSMNNYTSTVKSC